MNIVYSLVPFGNSSTAMLNDDVTLAAAVVRDAMANLIEHVDEAADAMPGKAVEQLRDEAHETVMALIACLITADGHYDPRERAFVELLVQLPDAPGADMAFLRNYTERWTKTEKQIPEFFRAAVAADKEHKSDCARGIMRELQLIANNCSVSDTHFADVENKIIRRYLRLLDEYHESQTGGTASWLEP